MCTIPARGRSAKVADPPCGPRLQGDVGASNEPEPAAHRGPPIRWRPCRLRSGAEPGPKKRGRVPNAALDDEARFWAFAEFRKARPLKQTDKLGYVLFQLAPWVTHGEDALAQLSGLPPGAALGPCRPAPPPADADLEGAA